MIDISTIPRAIKRLYSVRIAILTSKVWRTADGPVGEVIVSGRENADHHTRGRSCVLGSITLRVRVAEVAHGEAVSRACLRANSRKDGDSRRSARRVGKLRGRRADRVYLRATAQLASWLNAWDG